MPKYGRYGLAREFVAAVKAGKIKQPFDTQDVRNFVIANKWPLNEHYVGVLLPNGSSETHSRNYKKYFKADEKTKGKYWLSDVAIKEG